MEFHSPNYEASPKRGVVLCFSLGYDELWSNNVSYAVSHEYSSRHEALLSVSRNV